MRLGLTLAAVLVLSLAGGAMASDYMLPLLEKQVPASSASAAGSPPPATAQSSGYVPPAANQGIAMGIAAVAALAVVGIGLLAYRRSA